MILKVTATGMGNSSELSKYSFWGFSMLYEAAIFNCWIFYLKKKIYGKPMWKSNQSRMVSESATWKTVSKIHQLVLVFSI